MGKRSVLSIGTASNQHGLLVALCRRYFLAYRNGHIIIDGYSLPADFDAGAGLIYDRKDSPGVVSNDLAAAQAVKAELDAEGHCGRVHLAVGLPVLDSIALGRLANFYVCHVGTVQHKVGWFHTCPGVIHANSEVLAYDFGHIVTAQSEVAARVDQLPARMVTDDANSEDDEVRRSLKYTGYSVHVGRAVDFVMKALDAAVSARPNGVNTSATATTPTLMGLRAMHRYEVIQSFLDIFDQPRYLEIGVWAGETFRALRAARKVAIDPTFRFEHSDGEMGCEYHEVTSDKYFGTLAHNAPLFDVIFLDGMHTFEQTLRDLMNSIDFLRPDGVIVIDDVWPNSYHASLPDIRETATIKKAIGATDLSWMGDVYKLVYFIQSFLPRFNYATCEDNHGQLIMWRAKREPGQFVERQVEDIARLEFRHIVMQRSAFNFLPNAEIVRGVRRAVNKSKANGMGRAGVQQYGSLALISNSPDASDWSPPLTGSSGQIDGEISIGHHGNSLLAQEGVRALPGMRATLTAAASTIVYGHIFTAIPYIATACDTPVPAP